MDHPAVPARLLRLAEALVFASPRPATWRLLAPFLPANLSTDDVFAALQAHCAERGVVLVQQADGWVFRTAPDLTAELQAALGEVRKLPRVALEVLVVIGYHQPITRPEIEAVRGAALSQATMELLLESGLIKAHGRRQAPGTPTLWVTTAQFLEQFGLKSLRDLPGSGVISTLSPLPRRGVRVQLWRRSSCRYAQPPWRNWFHMHMRALKEKQRTSGNQKERRPWRCWPSTDT